MKSDKTLYFFTISFPFQEGETFIEAEFLYLAETFKKIVIITSGPSKGKRELPAHVSVISIHEFLNGRSKITTLLSNFSSVCGILFSEMKDCSSKLYFLKNIRKYNSTLLSSFICAEGLSKLSGFDKKAVFYSFWMNDHSLTLSIMKKKAMIQRSITRVHGYDLILERWPHNFIIFGKTCRKYQDRILTVSKQSLDYFYSRFGKNNRANYSHLGSADKGTNPSFSGKITLVSVSNIIPLKRLHLIIAILKDVKKNVSWIHFGEGSAASEIKKLASTLPKNIQVQFKGQVSQRSLFDLYREEHVTFFLNVSDSEGLPFTIIEAISLGIPVIATNAGGTAEIVNERTGILLDLEFQTKNITTLIETCETSKYTTDEFRVGVRSFWKEKFSAETVYPEFIKNELLAG